MAELGCGIGSSDDHLEGGKGWKGMGCGEVVFGERVLDSFGVLIIKGGLGGITTFKLPLNRPGNCNGCVKAFIAGMTCRMTKLDIGKSGIIYKTLRN